MLSLRVLTALAVLTGGLAHAQAGVDETFKTGLDLTLDGSAGLSGGQARGEALHGLALLHGSWSGQPTGEKPPPLSAYVSFLAIEGRGPTEKYLGDFHAASNAEGHESLRLYSWWLEGAFGATTVRAGALLADEEFAGTESGGYLINSSFGWPAFLSANVKNTGPAFFVPALGIRLRHDFSPELAAQFGVYDGDSFDDPDGEPRVTRRGTHFKLDGDQGALLLGEFIFNRSQTATTRWSARLGGWLHTADFSDLYADSNGESFTLTGEDPQIHEGNGGVYALIERTQPAPAGWSGQWLTHVRGGFASANKNTLSTSLDAGLAWTGLWSRRADDTLALGFTHSRFSADLTRSFQESEPGTPAPDYEQVWEIAYTAVINEHLTLQPDLQVIRHPGGSSALKDAVVVMLRVSASY